MSQLFGDIRARHPAAEHGQAGPRSCPTKRGPPAIFCRSSLFCIRVFGIKKHSEVFCTVEACTWFNGPWSRLTEFSVRVCAAPPFYDHRSSWRHTAPWEGLEMPNYEESGLEAQTEKFTRGGDAEGGT